MNGRRAIHQAVAFAGVCAMLASRAAAQFSYAPPGELVPGSGMGRVDTMVYAPGILFPIRDAPSFANSQVWGVGGSRGPSGGQCDARNFSYPWRDNYCETRSWDMPLCPAGTGHQGQDIRGPTCRAEVHPAVAVVDGTITNVGSYSVYLTAADGTRFDYLHMRPVTVRSGQRVSAGDVLGYVANEFGGTPTTVHLHFNIRKNVAGVGMVYVPPYMSLVRAYERLLGSPGGPERAAQYVHQSFPLASMRFELAPGQVHEGYLEMRNVGSASWRPGRTFLGTTEPRDGPSPLEAPGWVSPNRPASVDRLVAPGETGRFVFAVRAPTAPGTYSQYFNLVEEGVGWFSDDGGPPDRQIQIRVTVVEAATSPDEDGDGVTVAEGDCDDSRASIRPGAPETCGDGIDQDCDGADVSCPLDAGLVVEPDAGRDEFPDAAGAGASWRGEAAGGCGCRVAPRAFMGRNVASVLALSCALALRRLRRGRSRSLRAAPNRRAAAGDRLQWG